MGSFRLQVRASTTLAPKLPAARSAQSGVLAELLHDLELLSKSGVLRREEIP